MRKFDKIFLVCVKKSLIFNVTINNISKITKTNSLEFPFLAYFKSTLSYFFSTSNDIGTQQTV